MTERRMFEEDVVCDHCNMEIDGPGVRSGYDEGVLVEGCQRSGWMHSRVSICRSEIADDLYTQQMHDGPDAVGFDYPLPPNRRK